MRVSGRPRSRAGQRVAVEPGQARVDQRDVGLERVELGEAARPSSEVCDLVTGHLRAACAGSAARPALSSTTSTRRRRSGPGRVPASLRGRRRQRRRDAGSRTVNSLPCARPRAPAATEPPWSSTRRFTRASPRPRPPRDAVERSAAPARRDRRRAASRSVRMPTAGVSHAQHRPSPPRVPCCTVTRPAGGVYLSALSTQIVEHLLEPRGIAVDVRRLSRSSVDGVPLGAPGLRRGRRCIASRGRQRQSTGAASSILPRRDPRHVQQIVHETARGAGLAPDDRDHVARRLVPR